MEEHALFGNSIKMGGLDNVVWRIGSASSVGVGILSPVIGKGDEYVGSGSRLKAGNEAEENPYQAEQGTACRCLRTVFGLPVRSG